MDLKNKLILFIIISLSLCIWITIAIGSICIYKKLKANSISLYNNIAYADEYISSDEEICNAIYIAEGSDMAHTPFGIESIPCNSYNECRNICINTVNNKYLIWENQNVYKEFLPFLASKYAPFNQKVWKEMVESIIRSNLSQTELNCWSEDMKAPQEWDTYINSSYERLMKNETNPHLELSWLREHYPNVVKHKERLIYNCLNR